MDHSLEIDGQDGQHPAPTCTVLSPTEVGAAQDSECRNNVSSCRDPGEQSLMWAADPARDSGGRHLPNFIGTFRVVVQRFGALIARC